jgi:hypothetical protein
MNMKISLQRDRGASTGGWSTLRLAAWKAVLLTTLVSLSFVGHSAGRSGGGPGGGPGVSGGDETVGTLPIVGAIHIDLPFVRGWRGDHPAFYLEGTAAELGLMIRGARGAGFASVEVLDPRTTRLRIAFHGDVTLVLDRELVGTLSVRTGLAVPQTFGPQQATIGWGTTPIRTVRLRSGLLALPVGALSADGVLDQGPLRLHASGRDGAQCFDTVFATPQTVVLRQSY